MIFLKPTWAYRFAAISLWLLLLLSWHIGIIIVGVCLSLWGIFEMIYWQDHINKEKDPKKIAIAKEKLSRTGAYPFIPMLAIIWFLIWVIFLYH
jgi:hypothetical protein